MNRSELIEKGKIWQVYPDNDKDNILFEGNKTNCKNYIKTNGLARQVKTGVIRLGQLIWEETV